MKIDNQLWQVIKFQYVKPEKGPAFVHAEIKNVLLGKVVDRTSNAGLKIETTTVDRRGMTHPYNDGTDCVFTDEKAFEMVSVPPDVVSDVARFLLEDQEVILTFHEDEVLLVELSALVMLEVTHIESGLQGDRSNTGTKPATVKTDYEIRMPLFLSIGDKVKVGTRSGDYTSHVTN